MNAKTTKTAALAAILALPLAAICSSCGAKPDAAPPGPAVGATTPQGGVITVAPEGGRRPHMSGK